MEHVGSTSVPGLAAKPIIDIAIVVDSPKEVRLAIENLQSTGYIHLGNLGIEGREAFRNPQKCKIVGCLSSSALSKETSN